MSYSCYYRCLFGLLSQYWRYPSIQRKLIYCLSGSLNFKPVYTQPVMSITEQLANRLVTGELRSVSSWLKLRSIICI